MLHSLPRGPLALFLAVLGLQVGWVEVATAQPTSLAPQREFPVGGSPVWVAVGDLDNDGDLDAVVASETDANTILLSVLMGNGAGDLDLAADFQVGSCCHDPTSLALGDFNEDGVLDVVVTKTGWGSNFELLLGDGAGGFSSQLDAFLPDSGPVWVEAIDVDGDSHLDVALAERGFGTAGVLQGQGGGDFGDLLRAPATDPWCGFSQPQALAVVPVDATGGLDLILAIRGCAPVPPSLSVLFGEGSGEGLTFSDPVLSPITLTGAPPGDIDPVGVLAADLEGDSVLDVVVTLRNRPPAWMRASSTIPGGFELRQEQIGNLPSVFTVAVDLNEDGAVDLAAVDGAVSGKVIIYGCDGGVFLLEQTHPVEMSPRGLAAGLFNGDTAPDLITVNKGSGSVSLLLNTTFNAPPLADAGPDQNVPLGQEVLLDGSGSSDPDGAPLSFLWSVVSVPEGSTASLGGESSAQATLIPDVSGVYAIQLVASDGISDSVADVVAVRANTPPVADAGPDRSVPACLPASLDGTGSYDSDGDPLSVHWTLVSRPAGSAASLTGVETPTPAITPDLLGDYVIRLDVSDGLDFDEDEVVLSTLTIGELLGEIQALAASFEPEHFKRGGLNSFLRVLGDVGNLSAKENYRAALRKAKDLRKHVDGCTSSDSPDGNDWVVTCPEQTLVREFIDSLICTLLLST